MSRKKLSTTIEPENYGYLHRLVEEGKAANVGAAVDRAIHLARRVDDRGKLEQETTAYFDRLSPEALAEESSLESILSDATLDMNVEADL